MKKIFLCLSLLWISLMLSVPSVFADFITYNNQLLNRQTDISNFALPIQKFNPSLGVLNSIEITLNGSAEGRFIYENVSPNPVSSTNAQLSWFYELPNLQIAAPDGSLLQFSIVRVDSAQLNDVSLGAWDNVFDGEGASGGTFGTVGNSQPLNYLVSPSNFGIFSGAGNVDFLFSADATTGSVDGNPNDSIIPLAPSLASATVDVTYGFTPVPIPGAAILFASGLISLFGLRKKLQ